MEDQRSEELRDPAVLAIERVLDAERSSNAQLQNCRHQADAVVAASRGQAAAITRRTDARISKLHTVYLQEINRIIANQQNQTSSKTADSSNLESVPMKAADRLAAKLTGGT